jgi:UDP-3-O-[3-hydroxymyristoyl] glucosamine N-acyltransferase
MALSKYIVEHGIMPERLRYDDKGVYAGDVFFSSNHPRLDYCRALMVFEGENCMYGFDGSMFHERTMYNPNKVIIGHGCVIGSAGFGYEYTEQGELVQMPHLGNVVIEDNVTIHDNVCIARAVIGSTVIGYGTKIDNLVHIAHGVKIGKHCLIVSGAVFGGSCEIGDYCFIGMNASIKQKVKIGRNCVIGAGAVVTKDVPDNQIWAGNPAKYLKDTEERKYL